MKKLLLILAAGCFTVSGYSQESNSIMFGQQANPSSALRQVSTEKLDAQQRFLGSRNSSATARTTTATSQWYDLWDDNYVSGVSAGYYWVTYQDSNIIDNFSPATAAPYPNVFVHGMGASFDPTDSSYGPLAIVHGGTPTPNWFFSHVQPYNVDSIGFFFHYVRNNNTVTDSLIVEVSRTQAGTITTDSGAYNLGYSANAAFLPIRYDSQAQFATLWYDWFTHPNDCLDSSKMPIPGSAYRIAMALNASTFLDTIAGTGDNYFNMAINPAGGGIYIYPGTYLAAYAYFKSGTAYPLGTNLSTANCIYLYAGEPLGGTVWFPQSASDHHWPDANYGYSGSRQCGLIAQNQIRYSDTGFTFNGHNILIPSVAFAGNPSPAGMDVMEMQFHLSYTPVPEGVTNINSSINNNGVAPNPANNEVTINYSFTKNSNVTVTLSNMMGQVVGEQTSNNITTGKTVFNTTTLADGIYIYTIEANGERSTGRVEIVH